MAYATNIHLVSYCDYNIIIDTLKNKQAFIKACAFIVHNQDGNETHTHICLYLNSSRDIDEVCRWFVDGEQNTLGRANTYGKKSTLEYLLHSNHASIEDGKHNYSLDEVYFFNCDVTFFSKEKEDCTFAMLDDLLNGLSLYNLAYKYGRDFIFHYSQIRELADAIENERKMNNT